MHLKVTTNILEECSLNLTVLLLNWIDRFCVKSVFQKKKITSSNDGTVNSILICVISVKSVCSVGFIFAMPLFYSLHILSAIRQKNMVWTSAPLVPFDPVLGALCDFLVWDKPPPTPLQSLWFLRWKEHNRHCSEDDCPLSLFSLSKIIM